MQKKQLKFKEIKPNPANPRVIKDYQFHKLVKSLLVFPQMMELRPIVVNNENLVLGGNMRLKALMHIAKLTEADRLKIMQSADNYNQKSEGEKVQICEFWHKFSANKSVLVCIADTLTDAEQREFIAKDNTAFGEWDWDELANQYDATELQDWGMELPQWNIEDESEELTEVEEVEEVDIPENVETRCENGDIWQLGKHRLMCGDSTDSGAVALLMNGEKADISFFSPPYNAGFGKNITQKKGRSKYTNGDDDNKSQAEYASFLQDTIENANNNTNFTFCNIQMIANNKLALFAALNKHLSRLAEIIIWDKGRSQPAIAPNVLNSEFEFIFVFSDKANRNIGMVPFHGTLKNIVHIHPTHNEYMKEHNAVFPIELAAYFVQNFAKDSVLDLFGGTGTTMIAAEQLNRKCFMMEIDAHYCDIIIARWEKLTGKIAKKITD